MFTWLVSFYGLATLGMIRGYRTTGKQSALAPLLPLTFIVGYQVSFLCSRPWAEIHQALLSQFSLLEEFLKGKLPIEN